MSKRNFLTILWVLGALLAGCEGVGEDAPVTDPAELTRLAVQKQQIGAFEEAIALLDRAVAADPEYVPAHYRKGAVYAEWDRRKEAVAAYRKAVTLDPKNLDARLGLASAYSKSFMNELAIREYEQAAKLKPADPEIPFKIALQYWYLQKLPETAEQYRRVIALDPDHLQAHLNLASVYERMKQWDASLKEIAVARQLGRQTNNPQAVAIAENKLQFLKGRMDLTEEEMQRRTSPPFN